MMDQAHHSCIKSHSFAAVAELNCICEMLPARIGFKAALKARTEPFFSVTRRQDAKD